MAGLFGHRHVPNPKNVTAALPSTILPPNMNGAIAGASQNYGNNQNVLSNQSQISRGTFLGS